MPVGEYLVGRLHAPQLGHLVQYLICPTMRILRRAAAVSWGVAGKLPEKEQRASWLALVLIYTSADRLRLCIQLWSDSGKSVHDMLPVKGTLLEFEEEGSEGRGQQIKYSDSPSDEAAISVCHHKLQNGSNSAAASSCDASCRLRWA